MNFNRKEEILDAFIKLASINGIDKTTMKDIAEEVGISVGLIYVDYKNKEELIDAFEERMDHQFIASANEILSRQLTINEKLYQLLVGVVESFSLRIRKNRGVYEFASLDFIKYIKKKIKGKEIKSRELLVNWIETLMKQGVAEGIFAIEDTVRTAELFVNAFHKYFGPPVVDQEHEELLKEAKDMANLLIKAITRSV